MLSVPVLIRIQAVSEKLLGYNKLGSVYHNLIFFVEKILTYLLQNFINAKLANTINLNDFTFREIQMRIIDCRNMACPVPVIAAKRAMDESEGEAIQIIVNSEASKENITRFASSRRFTSEIIKSGDEYNIILSHDATEQEIRKQSETVILVTSDSLGDNSEGLGRILIKNFFITLLEADEIPTIIFFVNRGVLLATEDSEVAEALSKLENMGVLVMSCGICVDFYNKKDELKAGRITNMFTIAETLLKADKVVTL